MENKSKLIAELSTKYKNLKALSKRVSDNYLDKNINRPNYDNGYKECCGKCGDNCDNNEQYAED